MSADATRLFGLLTPHNSPPSCGQACSLPTFVLLMFCRCEIRERNKWNTVYSAPAGFGIKTTKHACPPPFYVLPHCTCTPYSGSGSYLREGFFFEFFEFFFC